MRSGAALAARLAPMMQTASRSARPSQLSIADAARTGNCRPSARNGKDRPRDLTLQFRTLVHRHVRKAEIAAEIDVRELPVIAGLGVDRRAPARRMIVIDGAHHISRNGVLQK